MDQTIEYCDRISDRTSYKEERFTLIQFQTFFLVVPPPFFSKDRVAPCSPGCSKVTFLDQADLRLSDLLASAGIKDVHHHVWLSGLEPMVCCHVQGIEELSWLPPSAQEVRE